jgi:ubiquinol-cytochrome c reductase iron-sulfur subunit
MSDESTEVGLPAEQHALPERFENPGLPPHRPRLTDTDPQAAKRAERIIAALFGLSALGTIGALVAYFAVPPGETVGSIRTSTLLLGLGLTVAFGAAGIAAIHWSKTLMNDREMVEERHPQRSDAETREQAAQMVADGVADAGLSRRGALKGAMVTALALAPLGFAVPLIGSVGGDWNVSKFRHTMWKKGTKLAHDPSGRAIKAADVTIGSAVHVIPEGLNEAPDVLEEKAKAMVLLIRLDPRDLTEAPDRKDWSYEGIVAYSKVCTHVGCPVALYEQRTHHLLCPCHQSTFDISDGAKVVFGPADRPLPQLPITVDAEGYLVAQSDFHEPVGPSFWERLK